LGCGAGCGSVVVFDLVDAGSVSDADAFAFTMSVAATQRLAPRDHPVSEPAMAEAPALALSRQVIETRSPALKSASLELAEPSTGRVRLSTLVSLADAVLLPCPGFFTVIVLAAASVETMTAVSFVLEPVDLDDEVVVVVVVLLVAGGTAGCEVRCFTSASTVA
jgi:hypothetical protein